MIKPALFMCENESTDQLPVSGQPISTFGFAIVTTDHYFCVATVCVGPCRKPRRQGFSLHGLFDPINKLTEFY